MATLPIEQVLQRQKVNIVAAPGVILWASSTSDWDMVEWTADVDVIDEVEPGEVALAQMASPEFFWEVVAPGGPIGFPDIYGMGEYGDGFYGEDYGGSNQPPYGIFQNTEYSDWDFGDGPFGGVELDWYVDRPQYGYTMTGDEYP
jgi:hypothetical protein